MGRKDAVWGARVLCGARGCYVECEGPIYTRQTSITVGSFESNLISLFKPPLELPLLFVSLSFLSFLCISCCFVPFFSSLVFFVYLYFPRCHTVFLHCLSLSLLSFLLFPPFPFFPSSRLSGHVFPLPFLIYLFIVSSSVSSAFHPSPSPFFPPLVSWSCLSSAFLLSLYLLPPSQMPAVSTPKTVDKVLRMSTRTESRARHF